MTPGRLTRRRLLAAVGTGLAASVAGCGYQPAAGELDWTRDIGGVPGLTRSSDERWLADGTWLFRIRNRSGRTIEPGAEFVHFADASVTAYDASGDSIWSESAPRQYAGDPAVADGRVYLPLEDDGLAALERPPEDDEVGEDPDGDGVRWTTDWEGPTLSLHAGTAVLVGIHEEGLVAVDPDDGGDLFALEREAFDGDRIVDATTAHERVWAIGTGDGNVDDGATLYSITVDGDVRSSVSLPTRPDWLETIGPEALVGVDDEAWAVNVGGERQFAVELEGGTRDGTALAVERRNRLYHYASGTIEAVDTHAGESAWSRDDYSFRGGPVADEDGIYGQGTGPGMGECGLVGVTGDGDRWWGVASLEDLSCSGEAFLVDDRLVVVTDGELYGFRTRPGRRLSVTGE